LNSEHLVLKSPDGRIIALECDGGTPDEVVHCVPHSSAKALG
jgi:hypothetical protein